MSSVILQSSQPNAQVSSQGNSSTGIRRLAFAVSRTRAGYGSITGGETPEVSLSSGDCEALTHLFAKVVRTRLTAERNESTFKGASSIRFSNRKDRQKADCVLLLKTPNRSPMCAFAERPSQCSWAPVEQVMDRRTEGAAGGSDAI